jgi:ubiquinone/menaquinone biosynthesis C-methylase UbiE
VITVDFNRVGDLSGCRILDIGCGSGRHLAEVLTIGDTTVFGADILLEDMNEAKDRLDFLGKIGEYRGVCQLLCADITRLPFADNFFDLVICSEVLEHIPDDRKAVSELVRVLKPGKILVVSVPRELPEKICWALSEDYHTVENGHIRIYKKKELIGLLKQSGLQQYSCHYAHSLHTPYWWLKCLFGVRREDITLVNLCHRLLVWDMMKKPMLTRLADNLLNPIIGKSVVVYLRKG